MECAAVDHGATRGERPRPVQAKGVKPVLGATMVGTCGTFCLLPLAARLLGGGSTAGRVRVMAACLTVCVALLGLGSWCYR